MNSHLHFIVTRPNNRVTQLAEKLKRLSTAKNLLKIDHLPLIVISNFYDKMFFESSSDKKKSDSVELFAFDGVIFISGNAVDQAKNQLGIEWWHKLLKCPIFAIGQQTAELLQSDIDRSSTTLNNKGLTEIEQKTLKRVYYPQKMNSEGFLEMPELKDIRDQSWLIVKGVGGRQKLKAGLQLLGAEVFELNVYQRKLPDLLAQKRIAAYNRSDPIWLVTSLEALKNLWRILQQKPDGCRLIVSSDRIAKEAGNIGFRVVAQSQDATDIQLTECVSKYILESSD